MGKVIHEKILDLIDRKASGKPGKNDRVIQTITGYVCQLHCSTYLAVSDDWYRLGVFAGCWQTVTTKDRINAVARHFKLPGIQQCNFVWYWTDGQPYDGIREFPKEDTDHATSLNERF